MTEGILANRFLKISTFVLSLPLLILLIINSLYADPKTDMIRKHMEIIKGKHPEIGDKVRQIEEKLGIGIPPTDCCYHCHEKRGDR